MKKKNIFEQVEEMEARRNTSGKGGEVFIISFGVLIVAVVLIGIFFLFSGGHSEETKNEMDSIARVRVAKENVQKILIDPSSAEFKDVHVYKNGTNGKIVCGYVNAKNRFGGFTGYEEFMMIGNITTALRSQGDPDFDSIWKSECVNRYLVY